MTSVGTNDHTKQQLEQSDKMTNQHKNNQYKIQSPVAILTRKLCWPVTNTICGHPPT